jgi:RNA polymerase sigma factor (sigma-70 family)
VSAGDEEEKLDDLIPWAIRIGVRIAYRRGQGYRKGDLGEVAIYALGRACAAWDRSEGALKPFAARWIAGEVRKDAKDEAERRQHWAPLVATDDPEELPPALEVEEVACDVLEALLDVAVFETLATGGEAEVLRKEVVEALHREIGHLDDEDRRLVELRYFEDQTWPDVAKAFDIALSTVHERDARIREHLRKALLAWDRVRPLRRGP